MVLSIFKWPFKTGFTVFYSTSYGKETVDTMEETAGASGTTDLEKESQGNNYKAASLRCVLKQEHYPSFLLVQPRKTRPCITERLLMGRKESSQTNKQTITKL